MRSRWMQVPYVHLPERHGEKSVNWLELFFDLIFVASFIQLGNLLSKHVSRDGLAVFGIAFVTLWVLWTAFVWLMNRFTVDDSLHRIMTFGFMFLVGAISLTAPEVLNGAGWKFALASGAGYFLIALFNLRIYLQNREARPFNVYWGVVLGTAGIIFAASALLPGQFQPIAWIVATIGIFAAPWTSRAERISRLLPGDAEHFSERFALLTLIVLGESFVKVLSDLSSQSFSDVTVLFEASFVLLITCSVWWIYFDDVAGSERKERAFSDIQWMFGHLPLQMGITVLAVGLKKAVHFDKFDAPPTTYGWLLCGALAATFLAVSLIDSVTERKESDLDDRFRVNVRFGSAIVILLLGAAASSMTSMVFLGLMLTVCIAQVIFDIFSSPMVHDHMERESISLKDNLHRRRSAEHTATDERRFSPEEAVRKGTPSQFRRDLYAFFMDGTWKQLFVVLGITFFLTNVVFASLYMIRPGCIDGVGPRGFWDAFYFSVQTISTIGYGTLSPITDYGNIVVTFEAATGLLLTALATGLMFAKASRPRANVMFTNQLLFTSHDGQPALLFRAANARGHEVVDASMNVTVLMDHLTAEGQHLRRMNELKLVRDRSPYFALSWTVIHIVDEESPLYGMTSEEIRDGISTVICTLIGYDSTYAQTVHARQPYVPSDFVFDHQFADILSTLPDGRLMIDYEKFHELESVDTTAANLSSFDDLVAQAVGFDEPSES